MNRQTEKMRRELEEIFLQFPTIRTADIPGIDLYMDQVTTFLQENLRGLSRDPEGDKFLTKTMINNYVKNKVLIPPVKKKYSREHMMLLIMIYYMKSFLSIGDIRSITGPVTEHYAASPVPRSSDRKREAAKKEPVKKEPAKREAAQKAEAGTGMPGPEAAPALGIADIYESVIENFSSELPLIREGILRQTTLPAFRRRSAPSCSVFL